MPLVCVNIFYRKTFGKNQHVSTSGRWQSTRYCQPLVMGITKSPGYQFHKEIDQPENEKALGPISKPLATVVGFRLLLIWAFWSISTGWIGHKWPENIGRPRGKVRVCGRHLRPSVGGHITLESITQKIMRVMWWVYRELSRQGPGATVGHRLLCWIDFHTMWFSPAPSRTT